MPFKVVLGRTLTFDIGQETYEERLKIERSNECWNVEYIYLTIDENAQYLCNFNITTNKVNCSNNVFRVFRYSL